MFGVSAADVEGSDSLMNRSRVKEIKFVIIIHNSTQSSKQLFFSVTVTNFCGGMAGNSQAISRLLEFPELWWCVRREACVYYTPCKLGFLLLQWIFQHRVNGHSE